MIRFPALRELVVLFRPISVERAHLGAAHLADRLHQSHDREMAKAESAYRFSDSIHDFANEIGASGVEHQRAALRAMRAANNLSALVK